MSQPEANTTPPIIGRCYCGACSLSTAQAPLTVAYCHCSDCKRWTGSPLPAFAAFPEGSVRLTPETKGASFVKGVTRWVCPTCGSPMMASFDYLPEQIYVPLGILDQSDTLAPQIHCHAEAQADWLHLNDDLPREAGSARDKLATAETK